MLNKNYEILFILNLLHNNITVNDIIRTVNNELRNAAIQIIGKFTGYTISHMACRNIMLKVSDSISIEHEETEFDTILIDGTKVKSGFKERGSDIHLAIALIKKIDKSGIKYNEKDWNNIKNILQTV